MPVALITFVREKRPAFTLIELLVVVAIVALVATIALPVFANAREAARQARCTGNLRALGAAVILCAENDGRMLPYGIGTNKTYWNQYISDYLEGGSRNSDSVYFCPTAAIQPAPDQLKRRSNYISNRRIMTDGQQKANGDIPGRVELGSVQRPSEVALLFDGTVGSTGFSDYGIWKQTGFDKGSINDAEKPLPSSEVTGGSAAISWRHGGRTNVVFVDGHVACVPLGELRYKNLHHSY